MADSAGIAPGDSVDSGTFVWPNPTVVVPASINASYANKPPGVLGNTGANFLSLFANSYAFGN